MDHKAIFSNITDLLAAHKEFQKNLDRQMASQTGRLISQCIINAMKPFRCYGLFCCEIPEVCCVCALSFLFLSFLDVCRAH